jgi:hypothetical protein
MLMHKGYQPVGGLSRLQRRGDIRLRAATGRREANFQGLIYVGAAFLSFS